MDILGQDTGEANGKSLPFCVTIRLGMPLFAPQTYFR